MSKTVFFSFLSRFGFPLLAGLIVYILCFILFFRHKKPFQNFWLAILFLYLAVVIDLTIPITLPQLHMNAKSTAWAVSQINWIPFQSAGNILKNSIRIGNFKEFFRVIGGNFVLLMPLGVLVPLINPRFRLGRMIAVSLLVPIGIEGLQLLHNILTGSVTRSVEMEDVVLNAAGCLLAYLIFAGLRKLFHPGRTAKHRA